MIYHLIGIGGAGMSVVAELLAARGEEVQGSDAMSGTRTAALQGVGVRVFIGHDSAHVPENATVVVSTAIAESNPELAIARARGQRVIHRSEALSLAADGLDFVAVAGSHGKTSTTAMIAFGLMQAGRDPSFAIGGTLSGSGQGARLGGGSMFVAEADESDGSFLNYAPSIAVVTNIERDHPEKYRTDSEFEEVFEEFARRIVPGGLLVVCADDGAAARLAESSPARVVRYGQTVEPVGDDLQLAGSTVRGEGWELPLTLPVPGTHNRLNALAAIAVARELGVEPVGMVGALERFPGTGRRFETRGTRQGVTVIDDYAHHPTEIAATIASARQTARGRVLVLFQPHLYSRTESFASDFARALDLADDVIVTAIYRSREEPRELTSEIITDQMERGEYVEDQVAAAQELASRARGGDIVLTVGAGSVTEMASVVLESL